MAACNGGGGCRFRTKIAATIRKAEEAGAAAAAAAAGLDGEVADGDGAEVTFAQRPLLHPRAAARSRIQHSGSARPRRSQGGKQRGREGGRPEGGREEKEIKDVAQVKNSEMGREGSERGGWRWGWRWMSE